MATLNNLKYKFSRLNVIEKIIVINIFVFFIDLLFRGLNISFFNWLKLPSSFAVFIVKPWTIITYAFMHSDILHLLFNMLWLYIISQWLLNLFTPKMALNVYFLGAIVGGLLFMLGYTFLPSVFTGSAVLVGASAAVRALLIFLCAYTPNKSLRFFTINLKLWHLGAGLIALDVLGVVSSNNQGGNLAHLGGALLGYMYAKQLHNGKDIGKGFEGLMDTVSNWLKPNKKTDLKTVYKDKSKVGGFTKGEFNTFNNQKKIDIILDKISKSGYDSLTKEEKEYLFRAGK